MISLQRWKEIILISYKGDPSLIFFLTAHPASPHDLPHSSLCRKDTHPGCGHTNFCIMASSKALSPPLSPTATSSTAWLSGNVWSQTYMSGPEATRIQGEFIQSFSMFLHKHKVRVQFPFPRSVLYKLITPQVTGDRKVCARQSRRPLFHELYDAPSPIPTNIHKPFT